MKKVIIYATKYGCTEKCAQMLVKELTGEVELYNLKTQSGLDLSQYDQVMIGGSIYAGQMRKEVTNFCTNHLEQLKAKQIGLFVCGMQQGEVAKSYFDTAFPSELVKQAVVTEPFGGEFNFDKMNFFERFIIKMVTKKQEGSAVDTKQNISAIAKEKIQHFAQQMNAA